MVKEGTWLQFLRLHLFNIVHNMQKSYWFRLLANSSHTRCFPASIVWWLVETDSCCCWFVQSWLRMSTPVVMYRSPLGGNAIDSPLGGKLPLLLAWIFLWISIFSLSLSSFFFSFFFLLQFSRSCLIFFKYLGLVLKYLDNWIWTHEHKTAKPVTSCMLIARSFASILSFCLLCVCVLFSVFYLFFISQT